ncbi:MAG: hypothetical protein AAF772_15105 [Acidobacteriota bacterium]
MTCCPPSASDPADPSSADAPDAQPREIGFAVDLDLPLRRLDGGALDLRRHLAAQIETGARALAVVFWSAHCAHCQRYDAWLAARRRDEPDLALLLIAAREGETDAVVGGAGRRRAIDASLGRDDDGRVARAWGVAQTPKAFLLDARGRAVYRGAIDNFTYADDPDHRPYLLDALADLRAGRRVARPETAAFGCAVRSVYYAQPDPLGPAT